MSRTFAEVDESVAAEMAVYLGAPGSIPGIGRERGRVPFDGIGRYDSPHGSVRYVLYEKGEPVSVLQVVSADRNEATIANVYTVPSRRRQGLANKLLVRATGEFDKIRHAEESHLSASGKAWRDQPVTR